MGEIFILRLVRYIKAITVQRRIKMKLDYNKKKKQNLTNVYLSGIMGFISFALNMNKINN